MNLNEAAENAYKSLYRKRKNNEILYSLFVICIDTKQKRVYIIIIRQEREPARSIT